MPLQRQVTLIATVLVLLITLWFAFASSSVQSQVLDTFRSVPQVDRELHLLLPATAANLNFCRLLLSSTITQYPEPILIGWGGHGAYDGAKSHLFKISETLAYLRTLDSSHDDDLVLVVDAYDILMIMPPAVMISRYNELMTKSNARLESQGIHGKSLGGEQIRNTLYWGPDKICWPGTSARAACWAVPEAPMPAKAFGPDTDTWMVLNRPRWLNSGTLIGPAKDMRDMFNATMTMIETEYNPDFKEHNSDQYYFQDVWAEQEVARLRLRDGGVRPPLFGKDSAGEPILGYMPAEANGRRTEYHISIDYDSDLFQTAAGYTEYLTWTTFNNTTPTPKDMQRRKRLDEIPLPSDLAASAPPFHVPNDQRHQAAQVPLDRGWHDLPLGVNMVTQSVFPMIHFTGDKGFRDRWWPKMWFHPHAEELLNVRSNTSSPENGPVVAVVEGVRYFGATTRLGNETLKLTKGGAWTDLGSHMSWDEMCVNHEKDLFLK